MGRAYAGWLLSLLSLFSQLVVAEEEAEAGGHKISANEEADFSVALMLMVSVTFMMGTFYFLKQEDEDLRKAAWQIVSATISIFCAVLVFQAFNGIVEEHILGPAPSETFELWFNFLHAFIWYVMLQLCLAFISEAITVTEICATCFGSKKEVAEEEVCSGSESEEEDEEVEEARELNMKCWAVLFGHITGFACINAFATLQIQLMGEDPQPTPETIGTGVLTVFISWIILKCMFMVFQPIRKMIALSDDGELDSKERMWFAETTETEDDVMGLTLSFVVVQVIRFGLTHAMPNAEGEVEGEMSESEKRPTYRLAIILFVLGNLLYFIHVLTTFFFKGYAKGRGGQQMKVIAAMVFSWCLFFALGWLTDLILIDKIGFQAGQEGTQTISAVIVASLITFYSYAKTYLLDKLADLPDEYTPPSVDDSLRELMKALGILIGFAWEKSFDNAVVSISSESLKFYGVDKALTKIVLSLFICVTVIPAWRMFILKELQNMGVFAEEDDAADEEQRQAGEMSEDVHLSADLLKKINKGKVMQKRPREHMAEIKASSTERTKKLKKLLSETKEGKKKAVDLFKQVSKLTKDFDQCRKLKQDEGV